MSCENPRITSLFGISATALKRLRKNDDEFPLDPNVSAIKESKSIEPVKGVSDTRSSERDMLSENETFSRKRAQDAPISVR